MHKREEKKEGLTVGNYDADLFLQDVQAQIQYKPAARRILGELYDHMEDKAEAYRQEGMTEENAMCRAVKDMGDASSLGVMLNRTHQVRFPHAFIIAVILAVLIGLAGNFTESGSLSFGGVEELVWAIASSMYFPFGLLLFAVTAWKGYPWIIRYSKVFLILAGTGILAVALMTGIYIDGVDLFWYFRWLLSGYMLSMPAIALSVPVLLVLAYKLRNRKPSVIVLIMCLFGISFLFLSKTSGKSLNMSIKLISFAAFLIPMVYLAVRGCFRCPAKKAVFLILLPALLIAGLWTADNGQNLKDYARQCFRPEEDAGSSWDDSYNSLLIKELLPQARPFGEIQLSQDSLGEYYTAEWYFDGNWDSRLPMRTLLKEGGQNVILSLTDILPQHYHNNYRIAFWILKYGWVAGLLLLGGITALYLLMFRLIKQIHNPLGKAVSLSCAVFLTMQAGLYLAGNFGFQFAWFTTLPFISEGLASISVNMILAGLITSAYSYDHVVEEEELRIPQPLDGKGSPVLEKE